MVVCLEGILQMPEIDIISGSTGAIERYTDVAVHGVASNRYAITDPGEGRIDLRVTDITDPAMAPTC